MLFKPTTLPEDLTASAESNYVLGELHYIRTSADTVFCLSKGTFFVKDIRIIDEVSGLPLTIHQDFQPIQLYSKATDVCGKAVWAALKITKPGVQGVRVDYRAVGGRFQNMLGVILEMKDQFDPDHIVKIPWNTILEKPDTFKPAAHAHSFWDMYNLKSLLDSLYQVVVGIHLKQKDQFIDIFDNMDAIFSARLIDVTDKIDALHRRFSDYRNALLYDEGDIMATMNTNNPANYLNYGNWVLLPNVLLIGAGTASQIGQTVGLKTKNPADWGAVRVMFWQRTDGRDDSIVSVTCNRTQINENATAVFTLNVPGRPSGSAVDWYLTGVQAEDIVGGQLKGTAFINSSGTATVSVKTTADKLPEDKEYMRLYVSGYINAWAQVTINDTSTNPIFECYFSEDDSGESVVTDASEGDNVWLIIKGQFIGPVVQYKLLYDGSTVDSADFIQSRPTTVELIDGFAKVPYSIRKDQMTEGYEILNVSLATGNTLDTALVSSRLRLRDSSITPTYRARITRDASGEIEISSIDEGSSFYLHLVTTDIETGTEISLGYNGTYNSNDFTSPLPTKVVITNNYARLKFDLREDALSESNEYMEIFALLNGNRVASASVVINDVSVNAGFKMYFSSNRFGTNELSWVNEGQSVFLIVQAGGIAAGTQLNLRYRGQAISSDFSNTLPTNVILDNEVAYLPYEITEDYKTEGNETFVVSLMSPDNTTELASANINIMDTSQEPTYEMKFTSDQFGQGVVNQINEGDRVYVHVMATGVPSVVTLGVDAFIGGKRATTANGDVLELPPASVVLINGIGVFSINTRADSTTEGDELLSIRIRATQSTTSPVVVQETLVIRDTSQDPTWNIRLTYDEAGEEDVVGDLLEGETFWLHWSSENVADNTVFWIGYGDGNVDNVSNEDFMDMLPTSITVVNNKAKVRYRIREDFLPDQTDLDGERLVIGVYSNVSMSTRILSKEVKILDPSFQMKISGNSVGTGSITTANEGDIVFVIINTVNVAEGSILKLEYYINGELVTVGGGDFSEPPATDVVINDNFAIVSMGIRADGIPDGQKQLQVQLHGPNAAEGSVPLAVANLSLIDTSSGGVTESGTYRPGQVGTISIPANSSRSILIVGGGGTGFSGTLDDPEVTPYAGVDGQATSLRFGSTTVMIAGGGSGGLISRGEAAPGGTTYVNTPYIGVASQFTISDIVATQGVAAFTDSNAGGTSISGNNTGGGGNGEVTGLGGGSGAAISFTVTNNTTAQLAFGVTIGQGGQLINTGTGFDWNNGSLVIDV